MSVSEFRKGARKDGPYILVIVEQFHSWPVFEINLKSVNLDRYHRCFFDIFLKPNDYRRQRNDLGGCWDQSMGRHVD